jgi:hypothetical protein
VPYHRDITAADKVYFDTDNILRFTIYQGEPTTEQIANGEAVPEDVATYAISWTLRKKVDSLDPPLIYKSVGNGITVTGIYNPDPDLNTQRVLVALADTDTYDPDGSPPVVIRAGNYAHGLKRIDDGSEKILTEGRFQLLRAAPWESA